MHNARITDGLALSPTTTRAEQIASVIERLPEHLRPRSGSFEDQFARACAEAALSADVDQAGVATVRPADLLYLARMLCGRGLTSGGDCYDTCRLQRQCAGSAKLVLASFGTQARAYVEALGLKTDRDGGPLRGKILPQSVQPALPDLRKAESGK